MMNDLYGYQDLPSAVTEQIGKITEIWKRHLKEELVGVYLHGSIALHAFQPDSGDIDVLIVVKNVLDIEQKLAIARELIEIDGKPCPVELSAVTAADAKNWKNPGNCVFHYSDYWTEQYLERFENPQKEVYVVDHAFPDADVTSYIRLLRERGIVLCGRPVQEVFAEVSDEDFWSAISADIDDYDFHAYQPRYLASNILILGRILSFRKEKRILSKYEGGLWMEKYLPQQLKHLPRLAMKIWYEGETHAFSESELEELQAYLVKEIKE